METRLKKLVFYRELQSRLQENKRLYRGAGGGVRETPILKFAAAYLGVNPWKVIFPVSAGLTILIWLAAGEAFPEGVLRILGGQ